MTGAYLFRLLQTTGQIVHLFDKPIATRCGLTPCAWGTSRGFQELVEAAGLDPSEYILNHFDHLLMDGFKIRAELMTFDKQRLIKDLLQGAEIHYARPDFSGYDRIIDASGVARAALPPISEDLVLPCIQSRVITEAPLDNRVKLGPIGYAWCFPLSDMEYHIGCGSLATDPQSILKELDWLEKSLSSGFRLCGCSGRIRLTGPQGSQPFVHRTQDREIWGVGEAIGCVAPLAGDGIVPGMRSVQILLQWWDSPLNYTRAILREFAWMKKERRVLDKLKEGKKLGWRDAGVLKRNSKRMGMRVGFKQAAELLNRLS